MVCAYPDNIKITFDKITKNTNFRANIEVIRKQVLDVFRQLGWLTRKFLAPLSGLASGSPELMKLEL